MFTELAYNTTDITKNCIYLSHVMTAADLPTVSGWLAQLNPCIECVKYEPFPCYNIQNNLKPHAIKCCLCLESPEKFHTYESDCNFCHPCLIKMYTELALNTTDTEKKHKYIKCAFTIIGLPKISEFYKELTLLQLQISQQNENSIYNRCPECLLQDYILKCPRQKIECIKDDDFPDLHVQNNLDLYPIICCICSNVPIMYLHIKFYCNFCFPCFIKLLEKQSDMKNPLKIIKYRLFIGTLRSIMLEESTYRKNYRDHDNPEYASSNFVINMYKK
jgi:hypothetical protein